MKLEATEVVRDSSQSNQVSLMQSFPRAKAPPAKRDSCLWGQIGTTVSQRLNKKIYKYIAASSAFFCDKSKKKFLIIQMKNAKTKDEVYFHTSQFLTSLAVTCSVTLNYF